MRTWLNACFSQCMNGVIDRVLNFSTVCKLEQIIDLHLMDRLYVGDLQEHRPAVLQESYGADVDIIMPRLGRVGNSVIKRSISTRIPVIPLLDKIIVEILSCFFIERLGKPNHDAIGVGIELHW